MSSFLADPSVQMVRCSLDKGRSPTPLTPRPPPHNVAADRTGVRAVRATPPSGRWLSSRAQRRLGGGRAEMKSQTAMSPSPPSPLLQLFPTASIAAVLPAVAPRNGRSSRVASSAPLRTCAGALRPPGPTSRQNMIFPCCSDGGLVLFGRSSTVTSVTPAPARAQRPTSHHPVAVLSRVATCTSSAAWSALPLGSDTAKSSIACGRPALRRTADPCRGYAGLGH